MIVRRNFSASDEIDADESETLARYEALKWWLIRDARYRRAGDSPFTDFRDTGFASKTLQSRHGSLLRT